MYSKRVHYISRKLTGYNLQALQTSLNQRQSSIKLNSAVHQWSLSNMNPYRMFPTYQLNNPGLNLLQSNISISATSDLSSWSKYVKMTYTQCHNMALSKQQDGYRSHNHQHFGFATHPIFVKMITVFGLTWILYKYFEIESESTLVCVASCSSKETKSDSNTDFEQVPGKIYKAGKRYKDKKKKKKKKKNREQKQKTIIATEKISMSTAIAKAQAMCMLRKDEVGSPGIVICVSVDGKQVYAEGFGYADLENHQPIKPDSVLRIASISKAITATVVAKLWEKNLIDLDEVVQHYVPTFPEKEFMEEKVEIKVRQLLNHTSGIRHYKANDDPVYAYDKPIADLVAACDSALVSPFFVTSPRSSESSSQVKKGLNLSDQKSKATRENSELERGEYLLTRKFRSTKDALTLFENDQLVAKPGSKYIYTTFAYTLLAAIVESVTKQPFTETLEKTFRHMGLNETYLDYHDPIIYNRSRCYCKDKVGRLVNAPHVDLSYKWAGGGVLSTVEDMTKFGNILLYSAQHGDEASGLPGYLKASTVSTFWSALGSRGGSPGYGLGFMLTPGEEQYGMCAQLNFGAGHTGAAIGASSALFILPRSFPSPDRTCKLPKKVSPVPGDETTAEAEFIETSTDSSKNISARIHSDEPSSKPTSIPEITSHLATPSLADSPTYLDTPLLLQSPSVFVSFSTPSTETPSPPGIPPLADTPSPPHKLPITETPSPRDETPSPPPGPGDVIDFSNIPPGMPLPQGVVVAVFTNMVAVSVRDIAENVARIFENVDLSK